MRLFAFILFMCMFSLITSCSLKDIRKKVSVEWRLKKLTIVADKNLNNGIPVAVDLLFIDEQTVIDSLSKMKALEWFSERKDYMRRYKSQLKIISYEVVPGQIIKDVEIPYSISGDAIAIIVFADYIAEGSFSSLIKNKSEVVIRLGDSDFQTID